LNALMAAHSWPQLKSGISAADLIRRPGLELSEITAATGYTVPDHYFAFKVTADGVTPMVETAWSTTPNNHVAPSKREEDKATDP